jgi:hypothetical protein
MKLIYSILGNITLKRARAMIDKLLNNRPWSSIPDRANAIVSNHISILNDFYSLYNGTKYKYEHIKIFRSCLELFLNLCPLTIEVSFPVCIEDEVQVAASSLPFSYCTLHLKKVASLPHSV